MNNSSERTPIDIGPYLAKRAEANPAVEHTGENAPVIDIGPYRARKLLLNLSDRLSIHAKAGVGVMRGLPDYQVEHTLDELETFKYIIEDREVDIKTPEGNELKVITPRKRGGRVAISVGIDLVNSGPEVFEAGNETMLLGPLWGIISQVIREQEINESYSSESSSY